MVGMSSDAPVTFRPERANLIVTFLIIAIAGLVLGTMWQYLWILLFPLAFVYWILRARTTVGDEGIGITYAFRPGTSIGWDDLKGVGFKGARALATTKDGKEYPMPGVTFNSLPELSKASNGRIPDALTAGRDAADEKVVIINRDGDQILLTKEEYAARLAANPETPRSQQ